MACRPDRWKRWRAAVLVASACGAFVITSLPATANSVLTLRTSALPVPQSIVVADSTPPVAYVTTSGGLYRSADPTFSTWTLQSTSQIASVVPNQHNPNDIVILTSNGIARSNNGGRTSVPLPGCKNYVSIARAPSEPAVLYAASNGGCASPQSYVGRSVESVAKSADSGVTWTTVYTDVVSDYPGTMGFERVVIDPRNPDHAVVTEGLPHSYGQATATMDGGQTWKLMQFTPIPDTPLTAIAFNPLKVNDLWIAWGFGTYAEIDDNTVIVSQMFRGGEVSAQTYPDLAFDPLTGRLYVEGSGFLYALGPDAELFQQSKASVASHIAVSRNGYLLTGDSQTPLTVTTLIGPNRWNVADDLVPYYNSTSHRLLGGTLSPVTLCQGLVCQYFDKGALQAFGKGVYSYAPLVADLLATQAALPIGGNPSTVTYRVLNGARYPRVPPPPTLRHGTIPVVGGVFVPDSPDLLPIPGYVVPSYFWQYMNDRVKTPEGWLHDIGLPLTNAIKAIVRKGKLGQRSIVVQAFQYAILTYDPINPTAYRVERANIGVDYAAVFPVRVR